MDIDSGIIAAAEEARLGSQFQFRYLTSRSAYETYLGCPRLRFYSYEYEWEDASQELPGVQSNRLNLYLLVGSAVHKGVELLLKDVLFDATYQYNRGGPNIGLAVRSAHDLMKEEFCSKELMIDPMQPLAEHPNEVLGWTMRSEMAIVEGLIRAWGKVMLPELLSVYTPLEVELEAVPIKLGNVLFQSKADCLLENSEGELFTASWKSLQQFGRNQQEEYATALQGITEAAGLEHTFRIWWELLKANAEDSRVPGWFKQRKSQGLYDAPPTISGNIMGILLKGPRREDKGEGRKGYFIYHSPLTKGYRAREGSTVDMPWAWSWDVPKEDKNGFQYMGNLGSTWKRSFIWEEFPGGIEEWIELLGSGRIQRECGDALRSQFVYSEPWLRSEGEIRSTLRQIEARENAIARGAETINGYIRSGETMMAETLLDYWFPQNRKNCVSFGGICPHRRTSCWGAPELTVRPERSGKWAPRKNHHELVVIGE